MGSFFRSDFSSGFVPSEEQKKRMACEMYEFAFARSAQEMESECLVFVRVTGYWR